MSRHGGAWKKEKQGKRDERGSLLGGVLPPLALHRAGPVTAHAAAAWTHHFIMRVPWPWNVLFGSAARVLGAKAERTGGIAQNAEIQAIAKGAKASKKYKPEPDQHSAVD